MNDLLEENEYYTRRLDVQKSCIYLTNFFKTFGHIEKSAKFGENYYNPWRITASLTFMRKLNLDDVNFLSNYLNFDKEFKSVLLEFVGKFVNELWCGFDTKEKKFKLYIFHNDIAKCIIKRENEYTICEYKYKVATITECTKIVGKKIINNYLKFFHFTDKPCIMKKDTIFFDFRPEQKPLKYRKIQIQHLLYTVYSNKIQIHNWLSENENNILHWIGLSKGTITIYVIVYNHLAPLCNQ